MRMAIWNEMGAGFRRAIIALLIVLALLILFAAATRADTYTCVVHRGEWVWIRSGPSYEARQIGQVRYGYEMEVSEFLDGFAHVNFKGTDGWVAAQYLELPIKETMYRVITEGGPLAKRETPQGRLMCWIKPGVKISVLGWRYAPDGSLWAKVYKGGYVCGSYLGAL